MMKGSEVRRVCETNVRVGVRAMQERVVLIHELI
jgi:hypothetical protein